MLFRYHTVTFSVWFTFPLPPSTQFPSPRTQGLFSPISWTPTAIFILNQYQEHYDLKEKAQRLLDFSPLDLTYSEDFCMEPGDFPILGPTRILAFPNRTLYYLTQEFQSVCLNSKLLNEWPCVRVVGPCIHGNLVPEGLWCLQVMTWTKKGEN